jgi:hypothetical protein
MTVGGQGLPRLQELPYLETTAKAVVAGLPFEGIRLALVDHIWSVRQASPGDPPDPKEYRAWRGDEKKHVRNVTDALKELMRFEFLETAILPSSGKSAYAHKDATYQITSTGSRWVSLLQSDRRAAYDDLLPRLVSAHPVFRGFLATVGVIGDTRSSFVIPLLRWSELAPNNRSHAAYRGAIGNYVAGALASSDLGWRAEGFEIGQAVGDYLNRVLTRAQARGKDPFPTVRAFTQTCEEALVRLAFSKAGCSIDYVSMEIARRWSRWLGLACYSYHAPGPYALRFWNTAQIQLGDAEDGPLFSPSARARMVVNRRAGGQWRDRALVELHDHCQQVRAAGTTYVPVWIARAAVCWRLRIVDDEFDRAVTDMIAGRRGEHLPWRVHLDQVSVGSTALPAVAWIRNKWGLKQNPFPAEAIAVLGGSDDRENGRLFRPEVQTDQFNEAIGKFVLGAIYNGQRFGALWSQSTVVDPDSRGYGKSGLLQYLSCFLNEDFGKAAFSRVGMNESDAQENPVCALLASFDTAVTKNLNSLFFSAVEYGTDFRLHDHDPTLYERLYERLCAVAGTGDATTLAERCHDAYRALRGRTLGPPEENFLAALCTGDSRAVQEYLDAITPQKRTRSGAKFLATMLLFIKAAGIGKVMLFCDQLEDFASPQTPKKTRSIEVERFRDFIVELLPMADMVSIVVTMHPRALASIEEFWQLADLPSLRIDEANRHIVVVMLPLRTLEQAKRLLAVYLNASRRDEATVNDGLTPFTEDAVEELWSHSTKKPRDLLKKAHKMITFAAVENLEKIDAAAVESHLTLITAGDDEVITAAPPTTTLAAPDFSKE